MKQIIILGIVLIGIMSIFVCAYNIDKLHMPIEDNAIPFDHENNNIVYGPGNEAGKQEFIKEKELYINNLNLLQSYINSNDMKKYINSFNYITENTTDRLYELINSVPFNFKTTENFYIPKEVLYNNVTADCKSFSNFALSIVNAYDINIESYILVIYNENKLHSVNIVFINNTMYMYDLNKKLFRLNSNIRINPDIEYITELNDFFNYYIKTIMLENISINDFKIYIYNKNMVYHFKNNNEFYEYLKLKVS